LEIGIKYLSLLENFHCGNKHIDKRQKHVEQKRTEYTGRSFAKHIGEEIVKADANFTREVTGFAIGGIPPIGHKLKIETFIDKDLLQFKELWAAAGTPNAVFNLSSTALEELIEGKIISIL